MCDSRIALVIAPDTSLSLELVR